jgi:hypothetical protein
MGPRRKRGVTHDRFRIRVCVMRILEDQPLIQKVTKTSLAQSITASLSSEFTARDATPESTLQDYLDREEQLFPSFPNRMHCCGDNQPCKEYPTKPSRTDMIRPKVVVALISP